MKPKNSVYREGVFYRIPESFVTKHHAVAAKEHYLFFPEEFHFHGLLLACCVCKEEYGYRKAFTEERSILFDGWYYMITNDDCRRLFETNPLAYLDDNSILNPSPL